MLQHFGTVQGNLASGLNPTESKTRRESPRRTKSRTLVLAAQACMRDN